MKMIPLSNRIPLILTALATVLISAGPAIGANPMLKASLWANPAVSEPAIAARSNPTIDGAWIEGPTHFDTRQPSSQAPSHLMAALIPVGLQLPSFQDRPRLAVPRRVSLLEDPYAPPDLVALVDAGRDALPDAECQALAPLTMR